MTNYSNIVHQAMKSDNPYEPPKTVAYEEKKIVIKPSEGEEGKEETPMMKLAGKGSYISFILCILLGFGALHSPFFFIPLMLGSGLLLVSVFTYIFLFIREGA